MIEKSDVLAAIHAEQQLVGLLGSRDAARQVADAHSVHFERKDNLRRVVLAGEWEIDPASVA